MIGGRKIVGLFLIGIAAATLAQQEDAFGEEPHYAMRSYYVDVEFFSFNPGDPLTTYHWYGGGGTGANGTMGSGASNFGRSFAVSVTGKKKANGFSVVVSVSPEKPDHVTRPQTIDLDLSNLEPKSLDLVRNDDGRIFRLNLMPRIDEALMPQQFNAKDLNLEHWAFPGSPVIVNDQNYIGELNMSGSPIAFIKQPGFADIEFSLLHLKGAKPIGVLQSGTLNITRPDGTTVRISNVTNGSSMTLPGGPYVVWVKWMPPSKSLDEVRKSLKEIIAAEEQKAKNGESPVPTDRLKRLKQLSESGLPPIMECGLKAVEPGDLDESAKSQHHSGGKNQ